MIANHTYFYILFYINLRHSMSFNSLECVKYFISFMSSQSDSPRTQDSVQEIERSFVVERPGKIGFSQRSVQPCKLANGHRCGHFNRARIKSMCLCVCAVHGTHNIIYTINNFHVRIDFVDCVNILIFYRYSMCTAQHFHRWQNGKSSACASTSVNGFQ